MPATAQTAGRAAAATALALAALLAAAVPASANPDIPKPMPEDELAYNASCTASLYSQMRGQTPRFERSFTEYGRDRREACHYAMSACERSIGLFLNGAQSPQGRSGLYCQSGGRYSSLSTPDASDASVVAPA